MLAPAWILALFPLLDDNDGLHSAIAAAGDVNGDGVGDVIVATRPRFVGGEQGSVAVLPEIVWVLSGVDGRVLHELRGRESGDGFGRALAGGTDLDGDGCADLVVGACSARPDRRDEGRGYALVVSGATGAALAVLESGRERDLFGFSVACGGDLDGDGAPEVAVGAPAIVMAPGRSREARILERGSVYLFSLSAGRGQTFRRLEGELSAADLEPSLRARDWSPSHVGFGASVAVVPDLDGDGRSEVLVGNPTWELEQNRLGRVALFSGRDGSLLRTLEDEIGPAPTGYGLGWTVGCAGDVDADGVPDLFASAVSQYVRVHSGRDFSVLRQWSYAGGYLHSEGSSVAAVGDVDGDGHADLGIGANEAWDPLWPDPGFASVCSGRDGSVLGPRTGQSRAALRSLESLTSGDREILEHARTGPREDDGQDLCGPGDLDGDGLPDLAVVLRDARVARGISVRDGRVLWSVDLAALHRRAAE